MSIENYEVVYEVMGADLGPIIERKTNMRIDSSKNVRNEIYTELLKYAPRVHIQSYLADDEDDALICGDWF